MVNRADCEFVVMRLWPYLDGVLSEEERERILHHLEVCRDCNSHYDFANAFLDAVAAARPHLAIDNSLRSRVLDALAAEGFRPGA
jgi:anti-sigma factor (TIGR02949 family)